jgi:hypothetical protein
MFEWLYYYWKRLTTTTTLLKSRVRRNAGQVRFLLGSRADFSTFEALKFDETITSGAGAVQLGITSCTVVLSRNISI